MVRIGVYVVALVEDELYGSSEDPELIETNIPRVEEILYGVVSGSPFRIIKISYLGNSLFDLLLELRPEAEIWIFQRDSSRSERPGEAGVLTMDAESLGQYVMDFFNDESKVDTWLEGDMSFDETHSLDFEATDFEVLN
ncbi:MAG: hypothetical protein ACYCQJ_12380 [Nitrososphaerales archaeon]